jgi:hypothetical protein
VNEIAADSDTTNMETNFSHELFLELDAFDPKWQLHYDTTETAAIAAGVYDLWQDYCRTKHHRQSMTCNPNQVPDTLEAIRTEYEAAASTSLPYRLDTIGTVRQVEE